MEYHYVLTDHGTEDLVPGASSVADQGSTGEQLTGSEVNTASNGSMDDIENDRNNLIVESNFIVGKSKMSDDCMGIESNGVDNGETVSNNGMKGNDCLTKSNDIDDHGSISHEDEINNKLKNDEADSEEFDLAKVKSENTNVDDMYGTSTENMDYNLDADTEPEDDVSGDIFTHSRSKNDEENHIDDVASEDINQENIKPEIDPDTQVIVLNKHNKFNARPKPDPSILRHECDKCDEAFQFPYQLARHKNIKHEGKYPYYCHVCNKPFDRSSSLRDHMYVHTDSRPFECKQCDKSFKMKGNLRKHIRDMHTEVEGPKLKFQCEYCAKIFPTKERLTSHFLVHDTEKPFACNVCGKRFNRKNNLKEHIVIHSTEKNFVCPDCGMRFNRKYSLKIHARNHMAVKPYKCELCPSSFSQLHALKTHFRLHTGEKPFKCTICEKTFRQLATLQVHFKRHTGVKDFKCGICGKGFVIKRRLIEHERLHTGEKPFSCDLCPYRAATSSGLRLHKKTHMRQMQRLAVQQAEGVVNEGGEKTEDSKKKRNVARKNRLPPLTLSSKFLKKKLMFPNKSENAVSLDDKDGNVENVHEEEMNHVVNGEMETEETHFELNESCANESLIEIVNDVADVDMYSVETGADLENASNENLSSINVNYSEASMNLEVPLPEVQDSEIETKSKSLKRPSKVSNKKTKAKEDEFENATKEILYKHLNEFIPVIDADVLAEKIDLITTELFEIHGKPSTRKTMPSKKSKRKSEIIDKNGSMLTDSENVSNSLNVTNPIVVQSSVSDSSNISTFGTNTALVNAAEKIDTKSSIQQKKPATNPNVNPSSNQTIIRQLLSTTKPQNTFPSVWNSTNRGDLLQSPVIVSNQVIDKQDKPFFSATLRNMLVSKKPDYTTEQTVTMATAGLSVKKENTTSTSSTSSLVGSSAVLRDMLSTPPKHYLISTKNSYAALQRSIKRQNVSTTSRNGFQGQWYTAGKPDVESDFPWVDESEQQSLPKTHDISISSIKMEPVSP